jgi:hypothetical protein
LFHQRLKVFGFRVKPGAVDCQKKTKKEMRRIDFTEKIKMADDWCLKPDTIKVSKRSEFY